MPSLKCSRPGLQSSLFVGLPTCLSGNLCAICVRVSSAVFVCLCLPLCSQTAVGRFEVSRCWLFGWARSLIKELPVTLLLQSPTLLLPTVHFGNDTSTHAVSHVSSIFPAPSAVLTFPRTHSQRMVVNERVEFLLWKWQVSKNTAQSLRAAESYREDPCETVEFGIPQGFAVTEWKQ